METSNSQWNSHNFAVEHNSIYESTSMAIDYKGKYAAISGGYYIYLLDLDKPERLLKKTLHGVNKKCIFGHSVKGLEWNQTHQNSNYLAVAAGSDVQIFSLTESTKFVQLSMLQGHYRVVNGVNWHSFNPFLLATSSVDCPSFIYDIRENSKPCMELRLTGSATQICWSKTSVNMLATAHSNGVKIWDTRYDSKCLVDIKEESYRINSLDWSPSSSQIITAPQRSQVNFYNIDDIDPLTVINCNEPMWRLAFMPVGNGFVSTPSPKETTSEKESNVTYNLNVCSVYDNNPNFAFELIGHSAPILSWGWRPPMDNETDYQLVSWGEDQTLRMYHFDQTKMRILAESRETNESFEDTYDEVDFKIAETTSQDSDANTVEECDHADCKNRNGSPASTETQIERRTSSFSDGSVTASPPDSRTVTPTEGDSQRLLNPLRDQLLTISESNFNHKFASQFYLQTDSSKNNLLVFIEASNEKVSLDVHIPPSYPLESKLSYHLKTTLHYFSKKLINEAIDNAAEKARLSGSVNCLTLLVETCLSTFRSVVGDSVPTPPTSPPHEVSIATPTPKDSLYNYSRFLSFGPSNDSPVPFPRTSGARFSGNDVLVCFSRPTFLTPNGGDPNQPVPSTPRSLSALGGYIRSFEEQDWMNINPREDQTSSMRTSRKHRKYPSLPFKQSILNGEEVSISEYYYQDEDNPSRNRKLIRAGEILVYNAQEILPISKHLAQNYSLRSDDPVENCEYNQQVALLADRSDLAQVWALASKILSLPPTSGVDKKNSTGHPWALNPLARPTIMKIFNHYLGYGDIQTAALLCCVFGLKTKEYKDTKHKTSHYQSSSYGNQTVVNSSSYYTAGGESYSKKVQAPPTQEKSFFWSSSSTSAFSRFWSSSSSCSSPSSMSSSSRYGKVLKKLEEVAPQLSKAGSSHYNTIHGMKSEGVKSPILMSVRHHRSNSEGSLPEAQPRNNDNNAAESNNHHSPTKVTKIRYLSSTEAHRMEDIKKAYSNVLYNWKLFQKRAEVQQFCSSSLSAFKEREFVSECGECKHILRGSHCPNCRKAALYCSLCELPVRGSSMFCLSCGHGGHTLHMMHWFTTGNALCPKGCGCNCTDHVNQIPS